MKQIKKIGLALSFCLLMTMAANAATLRIHNDTNRALTIYCYSNWQGGGNVGNWGGWKLLGTVEPGGAENFNVRSGQWSVGAQSRRGRVYGPVNLYVDRGQTKRYRFR